MSAAAMACRFCKKPTTRRHRPTGAPVCLSCATPVKPGRVRAGWSGGVIEGSSLDDIARQLGGPKARWYRQTAWGADPFQVYVVDRRYVDDERPVTTLYWVEGAA